MAVQPACNNPCTLCNPWSALDAEDCFGAWNLFKACKSSLKTGLSAPVRLIMGPWYHGGWSRGEGSFLGAVRFGAKTSQHYQQNIEKNSKIIVGVNKFTTTDQEKIPGFKIDDSIQKMQSKKIEQLKLKRNNDKVQSILNKLIQTANSEENIMPVVLDAVENYCTLGEIADALRSVFGEYK